ncbi:unnamed protein product [Caenorhabditis bovis]|uniref:Mitochondria-eating protein n=1 Tax=Caenorhabditis bovis TaxID=2654633 RepID=A0A8S1E989_9PELO|nr:unnamed protein product [Caenorhabditis bovis]
MAHKTSKSAGWSFKSPKPELNLIQFTCQAEPLDTQLLNHLREQVQSTDDLSVLFNILPPLDQLITEIPYTLPLLEAIYLKCDLKSVEDEISFPTKQLCCELLFCQLVWWTAFCEQNNTANAKKHCSLFKEFQPCLATLMGIIGRQCPDLVKRAHEDKTQLNACLESLGCHGLVNCSSGLIRMTDAVHLELLKHIENLKMISSQIKEMQDPKSAGPDPSFESHQRQMSMRLSQVFERLKLNETLQCVLEETFQNQHLGSLLRICRKRVSSDKLLIGLFNAFARAAPDDFALQQMDPIVAQLIVVFNNAYNKISKLRKELRVANYTIAQLREKSEESLIIKESALPIPDYPDAPSYYNTQARESISQLVAKLSELFVFASNDLRDSLDTLPELEGEDDLQSVFAHEILVTVHRIVSNYLEDRKREILSAIGSVNNNTKDCDEIRTFESAINSHYFKQFLSTTRGPKIMEEITQMVWISLKNYPGIEECITVHEFIQKCIKISWEILNCQEKKLRLEYEGTNFEPSRHSRGAYSGSTNEIAHFIWPALIDTETNRVLLKAIVLT